MGSYNPELPGTPEALANLESHLSLVLSYDTEEEGEWILLVKELDIFLFLM